jgi:hypothetical protein
MSISIRTIVDANYSAQRARDLFGDEFVVSLRSIELPNQMAMQTNSQVTPVNAVPLKGLLPKRYCAYDQHGVSEIKEVCGQHWVRQGTPRNDGFSVWMNAQGCKLTRKVVGSEGSPEIFVYHYDGAANLQCERFDATIQTREILQVPKHWAAR